MQVLNSCSFDAIITIYTYMRKCTIFLCLLVVGRPENEAIHSQYFMLIHSPTGPGFISISPLISSSRTTTATTTILPRPEGTLKPGLEETRRTLVWEEEHERHQMFDFTISFWRAKAGSMLLRDGSMRRACLKLLQSG